MKYVITILLLTFLVHFSYAQDIKRTSGILKAVKFCVISDVHYYDTTLGTSGKAFETYIAGDRKMIAQSEAIFESALNSIKQIKPDFLLITGDLTKDGEKINHQEVADKLKNLKNAGIQTYVVPGNHDVLNYGASSYLTDFAVSIAHVTPQEFSSIYADCGYNQAIAKDTASLSYVIEPADGLWIIAMDACLYKLNSVTNTSTTGGKFSDATLTWIEAQLKLAKTKGKVVIGMLHHGIVEHFTGEKTFFSEYVLDDYKKVDSIFTKYDMRLVFTGHYHAQDITANVMSDGKTIYDVETGSLVTCPSPYRTVTIGTDLTVNIVSDSVKTINANLNGLTFPQFSSNFLITGMTQLIKALLEAPVSYGGYGVSAALAAQVAPVLALAYSAHYGGDEKPSADTKTLISTMMASTDASTLLVGKMLGSLWTDLPPADNNVQFDIKESTTGIEKENNTTVPVNYELSQNYPNPFNPSTLIKYQIPMAGFVTLKIFNLLGKEIASIVNEAKTAGSYSINFDGSKLASGMYFYQLKVFTGNSANFISTKKMLLVK